jgi:hypothetical protein
VECRGTVAQRFYVGSAGLHTKAIAIRVPDGCTIVPFEAVHRDPET